MLKNIGLFCKRALQKRPVFCKKTCIFKHPTHRSHPILVVWLNTAYTTPKWIQICQCVYVCARASVVLVFACIIFVKMIHVYIYVHICICTCMYAYVCTCMCTCICLLLVCLSLYIDICYRNVSVDDWNCPRQLTKLQNHPDEQTDSASEVS